MPFLERRWLDEGYPALANGRRNANNRQNAVFGTTLIGGLACPALGDLLWVIKIRMPFLERRWLDEGCPALANGRRNANNRQNAVFEMSLIGGFACLRSAICYGLLKLECRSWNVAGWTRFIPRLRSVNRTPF